MPEAQRWKDLKRILGIRLLIKMIGLTQKKLLSYNWDEKKMPTHITARLDFLMIIILLLAQYPTRTKIRKWFKQPRLMLNNKSPAEILSGDWDPKTPYIQNVFRTTFYMAIKSFIPDPYNQ